MIEIGLWTSFLGRHQICSGILNPVPKGAMTSKYIWNNYERTIIGYNKILGPEHPTTIACQKHRVLLLETALKAVLTMFQMTGVKISVASYWALSGDFP